MGDDLNTIGAFREFGFWESLASPLNLAAGKIRPISTLLLYSSYILCGIDYKWYYFLTRLVLAFVSCVIFRVCKKMGIKSLCAYMVSVFTIICSFSAYGVWQVIGLCETFSLFCCIMTLFFNHLIIYSSVPSQIYKYAIYCTLFFSLLIFNAERFMYLFVIYAIVMIFKSELPMRKRLGIILLYFLPIIIRNFLLRTLGADPLGTGREGVQILILTIIPYAIKGFVNMLGFALGDNWHGGFTLLQIPSSILVISAFRMGLFFGIAYKAFVEWIRHKEKGNFEVIVLYLFSLTSLFSYALVAATHGEDRFLWVSYVCYCIAFMKYVSAHADMKIFQVGVVVLCASIIYLDNYYLVNKVHVHYRYSQEMAQTCIENIQKLNDYEKVDVICCVKPNDYYWVFGNQYFFDLYVNPNIVTYYYNDFDEIDKSTIGQNAIVVYPDANYSIPYGTQACWISDSGWKE